MALINKNHKIASMTPLLNMEAYNKNRTLSLDHPQLEHLALTILDGNYYQKEKKTHKN